VRAAKQKTVAEQVQEHPDLIPSMPDVVAQALRLVDDPNASPAQFEKLLSRDPPLVATILRLANSPVYGFAHKRESVREAVVGIGLKGLRGVLLGSTLKRFLGSQFACYGRDPLTLWRHALAVGVGSRVLAKQARTAQQDADEMFVAGLLHDLGKLLLAQFLTRAGEDLTKTAEATHIAEKRALGISHQEAGTMMAERWNLAPVVREVIARHHSETCADQFHRALAIVRLADQVATDRGAGAGPLGMRKAVFEADLAAIGLEPAPWAEAKEAMAKAIDEALVAS
jgi:putative nucleotidyltransferase with HDIG domain